MYKLFFLGTSASAPSIHRGLSSQMVIHNEHRFLIDCGEGTQRQIMRSGLGFKRLNRILITHGHLDHILGLAGLLSTFSRWGTIDSVEILAGKWALERIRDLVFGVVLRGAHTDMKVLLTEISPGTIIEEEDFSISAFPVYHRGPDCFGFTFFEKETRPFLIEKAEELDIPPGPWRKDLVLGNPATLPDGRIILPEQVIGEEKEGVKFVHVGDTGDTDSLVEYCQDADTLVIEATYLDQEAEMAQKFAHITAKQAAELAIRSNVNQLILTHLSRRYRDRDVLTEAQSVFPNTVVAQDFDSFQIKRGATEPITEA